MENDLIRFDELGLKFHVGQSVNIFGIEVAYYGIIIGLAVIVGAMIAYREAKRTGQNVEDYIDYTMWVIVMAVVGARAYYVIFEWDYYKNNLLEIFNIRGGGLAIYGGIIACVITLLMFAKKRKLNCLQMMDTAVLGLIIGQSIGRWGNFCNREAFGGYYTGLFSMQIPESVANGMTQQLIENAKDGFISVHPTFLYESVWNIIGFVILMLYRKHKKNQGEVFCLYLIWYGIGRFIIEGLRTDQLRIAGTMIAVSQVLSAVLVVAGIGWIIYLRMSKRKETD